MTREEVLELTLQVIKGKMWWETNGEVIIEVALAAADHEREACTKLFKELEQKDQHIAEVIEAAVQAERQPLTDTQIEQCMKEAYATAQGRNLEHAFARAIEREHGIGAAND